MGAETVTVAAWKLRRAAEILDRDGDEHGVAADLWSMLADAGMAKHEARPCGVICAGKVRDGLECSPGRCALGKPPNVRHQRRLKAVRCMAGLGSTATKEMTMIDEREAQETADDLRDVLRRNGFVRCDVPACNCGSWHARYGLRERMTEIEEVLADAGYPLSNTNGNLPINALRALVAERDAVFAALRKMCLDEVVRKAVDAA